MGCDELATEPRDPFDPFDPFDPWPEVLRHGSTPIARISRIRALV